ncbi:aluminum-activated malate transporter 12-like [Salvia miltiorrhiza]|uniref:aluminum-activated malate transporter 12-like n=1 Tax=Salvia miltiorrhiza TaxID=226208 RepID=UPI0025AB9B19|nr:aluminum-activated malate transporter 12-like [Salvia miltiorrhiza]
MNFFGMVMRISRDDYDDDYGWTAKMDMVKKRSSVLAKSTWMTVCRVGQEDPCRVFHALKVGFSLTLVSLLYLLEPFFKGIGQNAIWAVMTVVVVLEFTAGATLCKGLNRGIGTLLAGSLAFFIEFIAQESGQVFRAVFIGVAVFVVGTGATYMRFFPYIKKNYDYGVVIFLLTFNLITVSSYRIHNVLKIAQDRFYMIAIGCGICLLMSLIVFPNWSGQHLHNFTASKLEGMATSIEACVAEYFSNEYPNHDVAKESCEDPIYKGYKAVLDSKSTDETLAMHASWEPCHSSKCERVPWQHYVKLGDVLRHFGYTVVALHGCLRTEIQTPRSVRALFKDPCIQLAGEVAKALMELADSIRQRRQCSPEILSDHLHQALHDLDAALKSQPKLFLGPNSNATNNMLVMAAAASARQNSSLSSVKTDSSALLQWKSKRAAAATEQAKEFVDRKSSLRPTLSKIAITSLEFAEALPFAAFASLLVETVARLDLVIDEVEELGRVGNFREFCAGDDKVCHKPTMGKDAPLENHLPSHGME